MTTFRALEKAILSKEQLTAFQSSKTCAKVTSYIEALNSAVVGRKLTDECTQSEVRLVRLGPCIFRPFHHTGFAHRSGIFLCVIYII
jgi:Phosphotyrosyl phosphate activator (PTPA) protein